MENVHEIWYQMDLQEIGLGGHEDRDRWRALANAVMNLQVP
jgi:hypothetical protein